jgi:predicted lysophospholipase L1 biosynthesis ABC-type transport system permease subunit
VGGELIDVEIGGIVSRFPGVRGEAVVGNRDALKAAIQTDAPGSATLNELWLDVAAADEPRVAAALAERPFSALAVTSRTAVEQDTRRDPLGHGTLVALTASAAVALLLAVIGLALAVRADLRDERGELVELEAQGASPSLLLRVVRVRALLVLLVGLIGGGLAGATLALLVTRVVRVTARAGFAEPPLVVAVQLPIVLAALVGLAIAAVVVTVLVTRTAFIEPRGPGRVGGSA